MSKLLPTARICRVQHQADAQPDDTIRSAWRSQAPAVSSPVWTHCGLANNSWLSVCMCMCVCVAYLHLADCGLLPVKMTHRCCLSHCGSTRLISDPVPTFLQPVGLLDIFCTGNKHSLIHCRRLLYTYRWENRRNIHINTCNQYNQSVVEALPLTRARSKHLTHIIIIDPLVPSRNCHNIWFCATIMILMF